MAAERPGLVLLTADTLGGVWRYAVELAASLGALGVRVALATMGAPLTEAQRAQLLPLAGTVTVHDGAHRLEWMAEPWADVARAGEWLLALEAALRPDVVHLNQFAFGALPFHAPRLVVAHSCVCSWWRGVHGTDAPPEWDPYRSVVRAGLAGADLVGAPTRAMLAALREHYAYGTPGVVLPNGSDARRWVPLPKEPVVLAAGRLWDAAKNLSALEAVASALPWPVRVAGPLDHPEGGARAARGVTLLGELTAEALAAEMGRAAVFAHPARYEPFGLAVLEAALAGCALVLGDIPTLRELWDGAAAFVPPDDHDALGAALAGLATDEARRRRLAGAARDRARTFSLHRMTDACLDAYAAAKAAAGARRLPRPPRVEDLACAS